MPGRFTAYLLVRAGAGYTLTVHGGAQEEAGGIPVVYDGPHFGAVVALPEQARLTRRAQALVDFCVDRFREDELWET